MKTLDISEATKSLAEYTDEIDKGVVVVVRKGKPVAVLSSAEGMDAESIALANNPKFIALINRGREQIKAGEGIPLEEVRRRFGLPPFKSKRKKKSPKPRRR